MGQLVDAISNLGILDLHASVSLRRSDVDQSSEFDTGNWATARIVVGTPEILLPTPILEEQLFRIGVQFTANRGDPALQVDHEFHHVGKEPVCKLGQL